MAKSIRDAGEELSNNRRKSRPPVSLQCFRSMNETARSRALSKYTLWPRPNYVHLVENEGVSRFQARILKHLYDAIPACPPQRHWERQVSEDRFVRSIYRFRIGVEKWLAESTVWPPEGPEVPEWFPVVDTQRLVYQLWTVGCNLDDGDPDPGLNERFLRYGRTEGIQRFHRNHDVIFSDLKHTDWPNPVPQWKTYGYTITHRQHCVARAYSSFVLSDGQATEKSRGAVVMDSRFFVVPSVEAAEALISTFKEFVLTDGRSVCLSFDTEKEAIEEANRQCQKFRHRKRPKRWEPELPEVEDEEAANSTDEELGEVQTAEDLLALVDLRGVNFGNWVSVQERRTHLVRCASAFNDLASLFKISPSWFGQGKLLGIAFGAQGKGLSSALAHFVPGIDEINLTRRRGAGSLAHELGHFIDHLSSRRKGNATGDDEFMSQRSYQVVNRLLLEWPEKIDFSGLDGAFAAVSIAMNWRMESQQEADARCTKARKRLREELDQYAEGMKLRHYSVYPRAKALMDEIYPILLSRPEWIVSSFHAEPLRKRMKELYDIRSYGVYADLFHYYGKMPRKYSPSPIPVSSTYALESRQLDFEEGRTLDTWYWSTQYEMFARAFSDWVVYRLTSKGRDNPYLARDLRRAAVSAKQAGRLAAVPYLSEKEKPDVFLAIDRLVAELGQIPLLLEANSPPVA